MMVALHKLARTTPAVRAEIAVSTESASALAERYGISVATVYKWRSRDDFNDRPYRALLANHADARTGGHCRGLAQDAVAAAR